jgi:hypothetical protein
MDPDQRLDLFRRRVNELRSRPLYKIGGGLGGSLNISREVEGPPQISIQLRFPDEEDLRSFLLIFRQFISQDEPIFVRKIYNLCYRALEPDDPLRDRFAAWLQIWQQTAREITEGIQFKGPTMIPFKGPTISPEELADLWINGYYFHNDGDKYERLEGLYGDLMYAKANFLTYLTHATRGIDHLGHLVAEGMDRNAFRF